MYSHLAEVPNEASGTSPSTPYFRCIYLRDCSYSLHISGASENGNDLKFLFTGLTSHIYPHEAIID